MTLGNDNGTDGQTDRQTDGQTECDAICGPFLGGGPHNNDNETERRKRNNIMYTGRGRTKTSGKEIWRLKRTAGKKMQATAHARQDCMKTSGLCSL